jgi:hypothetical protein
MLDIVGDGESRPEPAHKSSVLIISHLAYSFDKWLAKSFVKVLLTSSQTAQSLPLGAKKAFQVVEGFDGFTHNSLVELRAMQLHATYKFHRIVAISEEDMLRAGMDGSALLLHCSRKRCYGAHFLFCH